MYDSTEAERGLKVLQCIENEVPISVCEVHSTPFLSAAVVFAPAGLSEN